MDESLRNQEIAYLLGIWEWCSRTLHVKWLRKHKHRNDCLMGIAFAISDERFINPIHLVTVYKTLPTPLLTRDTIRVFWDEQPLALLELCLGAFTKNSPLKRRLNQLRGDFQDNSALDEIAKKMCCRQKHFGDNWYTEGHHPQREVTALQRGMAPLCAEIETLAIAEHAAVESLAQQILAEGGWQFGEIPASWRVRKTPESLLNRSLRLKLWLAAQSVLSKELDDEETLEALDDALIRKITPSIRSTIQAQGYSVDNVVNDIINFDMHKSREQITKQPADSL